MDTQAFIESERSLELSAAVPDNRVVCIVDSSFNPPNNAHLKLARLCRERFPQCVLVLMLSTGNADKPTVEPQELAQRVAMMNIVAQDELGGDAVVALTTQARFADKAQVMHDALPSARLVFAMGYDTLLRLADQKYYEVPVAAALAPFFAIAEVLVLTRAEDGGVSKVPVLGPISEQAELSIPGLVPFAPRIHIVVSAQDTVDVSSSRARRSAADLEQTTPRGVARFVLSQHLYGL